MLFKRETDYGIRIVRALKNGDKVSVKEICEKESIPEAFAYKILKKLQKTGIVISERGIQGGYLLAKDAGNITLFDILISVEPDFAVIPCMHEACGNNTPTSPCKVHLELERIQDHIVEELKSRSLKEILND